MSDVTRPAIVYAMRLTCRIMCTIDQYYVLDSAFSFGMRMASRALRADLVIRGRAISFLTQAKSTLSISFVAFWSDIGISVVRLYCAHHSVHQERHAEENIVQI